MLSIAAENNVSETAFLLKSGSDYHIRWFSPKEEVPICGHGAIAAAWVIFSKLGEVRAAVALKTRQSGELKISYENDLFFIELKPRPVLEEIFNKDLVGAIGTPPSKILRSERDILLVYDSASDIKNLRPDFEKLMKIGYGGYVPTAKGGDNIDFVYRYFSPRLPISSPEDPANGSSQATLAPYWAGILGKGPDEILHSAQLSVNGGDVYARNMDAQVLVGGRVIGY